MHYLSVSYSYLRTPIDRNYIRQAFDKGFALQSRILNTRFKKQVALGILGTYATLCFGSLVWKGLKGDYTRDGFRVGFPQAFKDVLSHLTFFTVVRTVASIFKKSPVPLSRQLKSDVPKNQNVEISIESPVDNHPNEPVKKQPKASQPNAKKSPSCRLRTAFIELPRQSNKLLQSQYDRKVMLHVAEVFVKSVPDLIKFTIKKPAQNQELPPFKNDSLKTALGNYNYKLMNNHFIAYHERRFKKINENDLQHIESKAIIRINNNSVIIIACSEHKNSPAAAHNIDQNFENIELFPTSWKEVKFS